jgi:hypothetical protein
MGPQVSKLKVAIGVIALLFLWFSQSVGTIDTMPSYAPVFLDDTSRTYLAPSCIDEWQHRREQLAIAARSTVEDAIAEGYKPDHGCAQTGAFAQNGRSALGLFLVKLGVLPPLKHWWNLPYRTEEGVIMPPIENSN